MTLVVKQNPQHVHTVEAKAFALARTCTQNGRWRDLQGYFVYGELVQGTRPTGRPRLRYKEVCMRDPEACMTMDANSWEAQW